MPKILRIPHLSVDRTTDPPKAREILLAKGTQGKLQSQTWEDFKVDLEEINVRFSIGYYDRTVCILFRVREPEVRASYTKHLDPVFKDSCVEFFMCNREGKYVNIECNPIGSVLAGIGYSRKDRVLLDSQFFSQLQVWTSMTPSSVRNTLVVTKWEVLLRIPMDVTGLVEDNESLVEGTFSGNIYKCGDKLKKPHYISWSPITTPQPDFHQSSYFGEFLFTK